MLFVSPIKAQSELAKQAKDRRLDLGYTQKALADRAGVSFPTLRKFEQTGQISLGSFLKIVDVLDDLTNMLSVMKSEKIQTFNSISDVIADANSNTKRRVRGSKQ